MLGSTEIFNSLKGDLIEIGAFYDNIKDYKKYVKIGNSCGINTINYRTLIQLIIFVA